MSDRERVVITGMGIVSCLGNDCSHVTTSLSNGYCGIELIPERKKLGFNSGLSGIIRNFEPTKHLTRKQRKTLPEFGIWAWSAIEQSLNQAGIEIESLNADEQTGLIFGNDSSAATPVEQVEILKSTGDTRSIGSGHIFRSLTSTITLNISTLLGIRGMSWTIASACASGAMAIGQGAELIASGRQKRMICGGAQEITWESMCSFDTLDAFSRRESEPAKASRPFDTERDGLVPSGGAACLFLESLSEARARSARILGEITGYGVATDGYHIVVPSGKGIEQAMNMALRTAKIKPGEIDLVLAHATSTPTGDEKEAGALTRVLSKNDATPYIYAPKALTGHEFWMAGASQVVYGLLMAHNGFVAGNRNLDIPDPAAKTLNLPRTNINISPRTLLCNASGFGGTNASLIVRAE